MRTARDGTPSKIHGGGPGRAGALTSIVVLMATMLAGCPPEGGTGDAGDTGIDGGEGGAGPSGPTDGTAPPPLSSDGGTTDEGGTTDDAGTALDGAQGHPICSASWSLVTDDPNDAYNFPVASARMLALDGAGNMVVAASFRGTVTVAGQTFQSSGTGDANLLVVKTDAACKVLWGKAFGAPQTSVAVGGVATDASGNIVIAGETTGGQVDFGSGPIGPSSTPASAAFVAKLGPDGKGLWSHAYVPSPGSFLIPGDSAGMVDVVVDSRGNTALLAHLVCASLRPCNQGTINYGGGDVTFDWALVELDTNGTFVFDTSATFAGTGQYFTPHGLAAGSAGRIWAAGYSDEFDILAFDASGQQQGVEKTSGAGFGPQGPAMVRVDANDEPFEVAPSAPQADGGPLEDTLLYKFTTSGTASWTAPAAVPESTPNGSWEAWPGGRLGVDPSGTAVVSVAFAGITDFGSVGRLTSAGGIDAAIVRFDAQGHPIGGQRWGGADDDYPVDVAVDAAGDAIIAGWSVPPVAADGGVGELQSANYSIFVTKLGW